MEAKREENFQLRGKDSWIHCLEFDRQKPIRTPYHFHGYVELLYFFEGNGILWVSGEKREIAPGMLHVIGAQRAHGLEILHGCRYICVKLQPEILYADGEEYRFALPFLTEAPAYGFSPREAKSLQAETHLQAVMSEWQRMDEGFELAIRGELLLLFSRILRHLRQTGQLRDPRAVHPQVMASLKYIQENLNSVTAASAAKSCALSYHYYSRLFGESMGMHFGAYLTALRLSEAEKLLLSTQRSVTDIAYTCGFSGSSHFVARFKAAKGVSPASFRRQHSQNHPGAGENEEGTPS